MDKLEIFAIKHVANQYYKENRSIIEQTKKAISLYKLAVDRGDTKSLMILCELYLEIENVKKAEDMYLRAERECVPNALRDFCNQLSEMCYRTNLKIYLDIYIDMYEKYLHKYMVIEPAETIFNLADFYYSLKKDYTKFQEYFDKAYAIYKAGYAMNKDGYVFNDAIVLYLGAEYYEKIVGDLIKAEELYIECCNAQRCQAFFDLAQFYCDVVKDYDKMLECYQKIIDNKEYNEYNEADIAYLKIGIHYWTVGDTEKAKEWWGKGAETCSSCMYHLSLCYGIDNDVQRRLMCLFSAGKRGHVTANFELGEYYSGFQDHIETAKKYYKKAAKGYHLESMVELAFLLEYSDEGIKWLLRAGDRGHKDARDLFRNYCGDYNLIVRTFYRWGEIDTMICVLAEFLGSNRDIDDDIIQIIKDIPEDVEFIPNSIKLIKQLLNEKINIMKLHFKYSVNGKGFEHAKKDFIKRIKM